MGGGMECRTDDCGVLTWQSAAGGICEDEPASPRQRLQVDFHASELALGAVVLLVLIVVLDGPRDRLAKGNLQIARTHLHAAPPSQAIDRRFEVAFAGAREDRPLRLRVDSVAERQVLIGEPR